jgi:DNA-3-methyladenine glycosylase
MKTDAVIPRSFYGRDTLIVARELLGCYLVRQTNKGLIRGMIVETEAYKGPEDPASHAYKRKTERNKALFGTVGHAYIYFIYGNHFCLNISSHDIDKVGGILIRALEPISGQELMMANRKKTKISELTNGPGKLAQAFAITGALNNIDITKKGPLYVTYGLSIPSAQIITGPRVGISSGLDKDWRFSIAGNTFVSKYR